MGSVESFTHLVQQGEFGQTSGPQFIFMGPLADIRQKQEAMVGFLGFLAGFFPAREASRLDPVVAMKL